MAGARTLLAATGACALLGACTRGKDDTARPPLIWIVDDPARVGGHGTQIVGAPKALDTERGRAVCFDGARDGLVIGTNPIAGLAAFTIELLFRPATAGASAQRVVHLADDASEDRALLETRMTARDRWYLDTFLRAGPDRLTLTRDSAQHATGTWYWVALTYQDQQMRHYVNGSLEASGQVAFHPLSPGHTSLGMRLNQVSWFKGCLRELRISPAALPASQLQRP